MRVVVYVLIAIVAVVCDSADADRGGARINAPFDTFVDDSAVERVIVCSWRCAHQRCAVSCGSHLVGYRARPPFVAELSPVTAWGGLCDSDVLPIGYGWPTLAPSS